MSDLSIAQNLVFPPKRVITIHIRVRLMGSFIDKRCFKNVLSNLFILFFVEISLNFFFQHIEQQMFEYSLLVFGLIV
jgi:hypothetical protein